MTALFLLLINVGPFSLLLLASTRGFTVRGRSSNLILLRVTDTALPDNHNVSRLQASSLSSTVAIVTAGLTKIQQMVGSTTTGTTTTTTAGGTHQPPSSTFSGVSSFHQNSPDQ
jgi:hypothetical protein